MAFIDAGDQFIALAEGEPSPTITGHRDVVDDRKCQAGIEGNEGGNTTGQGPGFLTRGQPWSRRLLGDSVHQGPKSWRQGLEGLKKSEKPSMNAQKGLTPE